MAHTNHQLTNEQAYKLGYFDGYFMGVMECELDSVLEIYYWEGYRDGSHKYTTDNLKAA